MIIYDIKDDPVLQVSSKEPSTSFKSPLLLTSPTLIGRHPIKRNTYKPSYLRQILMDLEKIAQACPMTIPCHPMTIALWAG